MLFQDAAPLLSHHGYKLKEVADHLGIHYSTISKILKRYQRNSQFTLRYLIVTILFA
ncbi:MAG: helix-turn-helix domain-containing protein [Actinobacteria bacterium]|nr:helix-turn-helix domain-containing protein [Actinomycetota bacterium]